MTRPTPPRAAAPALLALLLALLPACDKNDAAPPAPGGNAPAAAAAPSGPKPGYATGRVTMDGGKPITAPNAKVAVGLAGISGKSGEKVYYSPKVGPDGAYEQKLTDGAYRYSLSRVTVPFDGKVFHFDLAPVGDDARTDRESDKGIAQDFVWKLRGLRPDQDADESNFTKWYGAGVNMQFNIYREDIKKGVQKGPPGTKCVFTLTPQGKLVDGSDGQALTFTREYDPLLTGLKNGLLHDVPLGIYKVTGEEIAPDGSKRPLLIKQGYDKYGDSAEVHFAPGSGSGAWPAMIGFTRNE